MSTQRTVAEDEEIESLKRGDGAGAILAAREELLAKQVANAESAAVYTFFKKHAADVLGCQANEAILVKEARTYGAVITEAILELALLKVRGSLIAPLPPERKPTAEELTKESNKRLVAMNQDEIRAKMKRLHPGYKIAQDVVSPELLQMQGKADILRMSGDQLTKLMYRSDGSKRTANVARINELLQTN